VRKMFTNFFDIYLKNTCPKDSIPFEEADIIVLHSALDYGKALDINMRKRDNRANLDLWHVNGTSAQKFIVVKNTNGTYSFAAYCSGRYLDVENGVYQRGQNVRQYDANGTGSQSWVPVANSDGTVSFRCAMDSKYMLDVRGGSTADNTNIQIWTDNGKPSQKFKVEVVGKVPYKTGKYHIKSAVGSDMMLDVNKTSTADGTEIVIYSKGNTPSQEFRLMYGAEGSYRLITFCGKAVDVKNAGAEETTKIQQHTANYTKAQNWFIKDAGDDTVNLVSEANGLCMDVDNAKTADGTDVWCYRNDNTKAVKWIIY